MLTELLEKTAANDAGRIALVWRDGQMSYAELVERVQRTAGGLRARGIDRGQIAALVLGNTPDFVITFFAATSIGAVVLPLNRDFQERELIGYVTDARASIVVADGASYDVCQKIAEAIAPVPVVLAGKSLESDAFSGLDTTPNQDALFQYSSGSTGSSKRAVRTMLALRTE